jgi:pyruvate/2-oxoglutarate dehydrogenase complex dihydrolipoamide acyltransferase (E2) component
MFGAIEDRVIVEEGAMTLVRILPIRVSYDERIDDGMTAQAGMDKLAQVLSDPERWLGGLDGEGLPMSEIDLNADA